MGVRSGEKGKRPVKKAESFGVISAQSADRGDIDQHVSQWFRYPLEPFENLQRFAEGRVRLVILTEGLMAQSEIAEIDGRGVTEPGTVGAIGSPEPLARFPELARKVEPPRVGEFRRLEVWDAGRLYEAQQTDDHGAEHSGKSAGKRQVDRAISIIRASS